MCRRGLETNWKNTWKLQVIHLQAGLLPEKYRWLFGFLLGYIRDTEEVRSKNNMRRRDSPSTGSSLDFKPEVKEWGAKNPLNFLCSLAFQLWKIDKHTEVKTDLIITYTFERKYCKLIKNNQLINLEIL